jgi:signal transduction histidine kinase
MTPALRRALGVCAGALLLLVAWGAGRVAEPPPATVLAQAHFAETVDDPDPRPVAMPHRWFADCPGCRIVWYRVDLARAEPPRDTQYVLLPAAARNAALYLNGRLLAQGGRFSEPIARLGARPLGTAVPASYWATGDNVLYVLVKAEWPRQGFVAGLALGAEADLVRAHETRVVWGQALPQFVAIAALIVAIGMALVWNSRRHETEYAALAVAGAAIALHIASGLWAEPPWSASAWDRWLATTELALAVAVLVLVARLAAIVLPRAVRFGGAGVLAAAAVAIAADAGGSAAAAAGALSAALIAAGGIALAWVGWRAGATRRLAAGGVLAVAAAADALRPTLLADPAALAWLPWALLVLLSVAAWRLLARFVDALNAAERLNLEMERRRALAAERERLMRDMHDGVGGHLVSLLAMLEAAPHRPEQLATAVRDALDDMRLMIDSLEPIEDDLNVVLAMWHDRLAPRLAAGGVDLQWDVPLLDAVPGLTPARVLHVLRILQEAVTNAIRHGRARRVALSAADGGDVVRIVVDDDGGGFDPRAPHAGRGLKNMRRRAAEIGAALDIDSTPGRGTRLRLELARGTSAAQAASGAVAR